MVGTAKAELRSWCREHYGANWHTEDKAKRLAEARAALGGFDAAASKAEKASKKSTRSSQELLKELVMLGRKEMAKDAAELQKALEENPYFLGPMFHLSSLQQHWNMLDWDGVSFRAVDGSAMCCGDRQREKMLGFMNDVIEDGAADYMNPFGPDDTEAFIKAFAKLSKKRQRRFYDVALECVENDGSIGDAELLRVLKG